MTDKTMTLEPCPFCGCKDNLGRVYSGTHDEYYVKCFDCDACGPIHADDNDACGAWSKRHLSQTAERGEAVAWMRPSSEGYDSAFRDASTVERCKEGNWVSEGWIPLYTAPPPAAVVPDVKAMVDRFLSWRLPDDFHPDGGVSFKHVKNPSWTHDNWPVGTNLFTAKQAESMLRHVLSATTSPATDVAAVRDVAEWLAQHACAEVPGMAEQADKLARAIGDAK